MQINKRLLEEIYEDAGSKRLLRAREYEKSNKVNISKAIYDDEDNFEITSYVIGSYDDYNVKIRVKDGELEEATCECPDYYERYGACKHIIATLMKFEHEKFWNNENNRNHRNGADSKYINFKKVITELYNEEVQEINSEEMGGELPLNKKIKIEPKITFDKFEKKLKLEIRIGNSKMYKIKDFVEFYTRMVTKDYHRYGEKLEFLHTRENFTTDSQELLDFVLRYSEMLKYAENVDKYTYYGSTLNHSSITLGENILDEIFDILIKNNNIDEKKTNKITFVEKNPEILFELTQNEHKEYKINSNKDLFNVIIFNGKKHTYILDLDNMNLYRCTEQFTATTIKLIKLFKENYITELNFRKEDFEDLYSILMPKVGKAIKLKDIDEKEIEKYKPKRLVVKVFLDFDKNNYIIADVKFCYEDEEFNPLEENIKIKYTRNILSENRSLNIIRKTGFMVDKRNLRFILPDNDKIYNFLTNDIEIYMKNFEVMVTENFKSKEIKKPKLGSLGIKVENNLLYIDLSKINVDLNELEDIMKKYELKKKYYRLKDGSFLNLEENEDIELIEKITTGANIDYKELKNDVIKLPVNRSLYLNELLKNLNNTKVNKNSEFKEIIENLGKDNIDDEVTLPKNLNTTLRDYQKTGFKWLKVLDYYKFGGILADDMGLGKTIQILSLILSYAEEEKENKKTTIVISPSSLTLNWYNETKKFAPTLKTLVIKGNSEERKRQINSIENYDLVITSYDLLKRDLELYETKNYNFRYIIADEAQYMKNSTTQNAKAIKQLQGDTRFALTGTPIENSLAELWSIFDFIMPGYLFEYKKFKSLYEVPIVKDNDQSAMEKLKMLIQPFILRRTKKQVLTELPEKMITVLNNQMQPEQEEIYMSYLLQAREELNEQISINGFEKSHIKILALLTRLRQICCHPSLFIKDYKGESSKLIQCMEIINDAISSGHKILLFSGYTSMFEILQKELEKNNIKYFKLTGSTNVDERINLVNEFNENPEIKVFLISLKAGGTGLNLTGADMVIHYDPWWNQSAENQATDRAYRIGQKNNVQVYKLITTNSIEEKIYELQNKKAKLVDNMLDTKTSFINKFSKDEIMSLFE